MRPRFGLREMLMVIAILCVLLGIASSQWLKDRRQQAIMEQCVRLLSAEGRVQVTPVDGAKDVYIDFDGQLSPASAQALCNAVYVKCVSLNAQLNGALSPSTVAVLRKSFVQPDPSSIAPEMWGRPGDARFVRFVEDRGGKVPRAVTSGK